MAQGAGTAPGAGVTVGFVATGIDLGHPLFTGNVTEEFLLSAEDEAGTETSHGTAVASVVGANFLGLLPEQRHLGFRGVAPRADRKMFAILLSSGNQPHRPISLAGLAGVDSEFQDIVNALRAGGVDVANLSFGFRGIVDDYSGADLRAALGNAIAAMAQVDAEEKTILVWAAGNGRNEDCTAGTDHCVRGAINAVAPEILAGLPARIRELRGHALAVVAVGKDSDEIGCLDIASFSSRCSITADWCIAAPGADVEIAIFGRVNGVEGQRAIGSGNGTSFAAPMVAGGLAVMKQLFRGQFGNEELVGRLSATASKEGPFSNASVYGQGLMDLGAATSPVGPAMVTMGRTVDPVGFDIQTTGIMSGLALGDGLHRALAGREFVAIDQLGAPFWYRISAFTTPARESELADELRALLSDISGALHHRSLRDQSIFRWSHGTVVPKSNNAPMRLGMLRTSDPHRRRPSSLARGFVAVTLRPARRLGASFFSMSTAAGRYPVSGLTVAYQPRGVPAGFRVGWVSERRTALGSTASGGFGQLSADAFFAGLETAIDASAWRLFADAELGAVSPRHEDGLVTGISSLTTSTFALGASRRAGANNTLTFALSQPLRVEHGQATLSVPVGRTKEGDVVHSSLQADFRSTGRHLEISARWNRALAEGAEVLADVAWTHHLGHPGKCRTVASHPGGLASPLLTVLQGAALWNWHLCDAGA